jgi:D-alanine-D-alanine ligase
MKPLFVKHAADFGKVAVLMGGNSAEREISLRSGNAVFNALKHQGIDVIAVDITENILKVLSQLKIDRVFNIVHGRGGEDGVLQAVLGLLKLPYTGSGIMASALSMDKLRTKLCWKGMGLPTPKWFVMQNVADVDECINSLGLPVIVKPAMEGSSIGMSKAENRDELVTALQKALQFNCDVYAEQWIYGKEYTVGILANEALPVIRLETPNTFYDFDAKYCANTTQYHCPCGLTAEREQDLKALALKACLGLGVSGWARVDVFIDDNDSAQLIEVNTVPGMTDHSLVPMAAKSAGIEFDELVWRILETSETK